MLSLLLGSPLHYPTPYVNSVKVGLPFKFIVRDFHMSAIVVHLWIFINSKSLITLMIWVWATSSSCSHWWVLYSNLHKLSSHPQRTKQLKGLDGNGGGLPGWIPSRVWFCRIGSLTDDSPPSPMAKADTFTTIEAVTTAAPGTTATS